MRIDQTAAAFLIAVSLAAAAAGTPKSQLVTDSVGILDEFFAADAIAQGLERTRENQAEAAKPDVKPERAQQIRAENAAIAQARDEAAERFPESLPVQNAAAAAAIDAKHLDVGMRYADKAVQLAEARSDAKELVEALRTRAIGALWSGDYPKAAEDAARVLKLKPDDANARVVYQHSKGRQKLASAPGAAPQTAPEARPLSDWQPSVLDDPRIKQAARRASDRRAALRALEDAMAAFGREDAQAALAAAIAAQRADPTLADAHFQQAMAYRLLKDLARALEQATKAIQLWTLQGKKDHLGPAYALRATLANDLKEHGRALEDADASLAYRPSAKGHFERSRGLAGLGRKGEEVLAALKKAAELDPPNYQTHYEQALAAQDAAPGPAAGAAGPKPALGALRAVLAAAAALLIALAGFAAWLARGGARLPRMPWTRAGAAPEGGRQKLDAQYEIVEQIGEGGMGAVYKGWDRVLKRSVAIKRLRGELQGNPRERDRFIREAELVASLRHPNIVEIYNILKKPEATYLVFEHIVGTTVHELLNDSPGRRFAPKRALDVLRQMAAAVDHAHGRHVIHRDLKPANVMIADQGWVKVMDFGIARQVQDSLMTTTNTIVGTPTYMPPEQALGAVVKESDIFALGACLYEMITGGLPFKGSNEMQDKLEGNIVPASVLAPDLPQAIDLVLAKALAAKPERRFRSGEELYKAAREAFDGRVTPARP